MKLIGALFVLLAALHSRRLSSTYRLSKLEIVMPATLSATASKSQIHTQVLEAINVYGPLNISQLKTLLPDSKASQLIEVISELRTNRLIDFNRTLSAFTLSPDQEPLPANTEVMKPSHKLKEITLRVSPGLHKALQQYARLQETSIESEAQHLLAEIVRMYQHTHVIPTQT